MLVDGWLGVWVMRFLIVGLLDANLAAIGSFKRLK